MDEYDYLSFDEEEEDDDYYEEEESDLEHVSPGKPTRLVITKDTLVAAQRVDLVRVIELLSIKENQARALLIHHQWNVDKLFNVYADRGKDSLFKSAGLAVFDPSFSKARSSKKKKMNCEICMEEDLPSSVMTRMECDHCFCNDCWEGHFTVKINEGESKRIRCMAHKCKAICDEEVVRRLVSPDLAEKFDRFLLESYVEDNNMVKWCPSIPHCGNAIKKLQVDDDDEVMCSCGLQFCFRCLCESHSPCSCLMWKLWSKKCEDESETVNWITANTKLCPNPNCNKPVDKRDGCNHMTCICGQYFCWICGQATGRDHSWSSIAGHSCGKYKEVKERQMERAKRDLDRYVHYYNRYKAHTDSSKLEDKVRESILEKALSNSEKNDEVVFKDFAWVIDGVNRLFISRRMLSYSYPFAFYMFGEELFKDEMSNEEREMKKNLFEDQQQQLADSIEKLSKILAEPFDQYSYDRVLVMKDQMKDLCPLVDNYCKKMYECIENELLGPIQVGIHNIPPYKSKGIEQAAKFCPDMRQSSD